MNVERKNETDWILAVDACEREQYDVETGLEDSVRIDAYIPSSPCPGFMYLSLDPDSTRKPRAGVYSSPRLSRTHLLALLLNSFGSSLHNLAASTFAGLSSLGLDSIEMTDSRIVSGV